jgi:DNA-binding transcriptional ArsR family regulator
MQLISYEHQADHSLDATFAALADPTRLAILIRLASNKEPITRS